LVTFRFYLGFIATDRKRYGQFFLGVQTWSRKIFVINMPNLKLSSFERALSKMLKDKDFAKTKLLLFDGESALQSKKNQALLQKKFQIRVRAESGFKRLLAERMIREVKTRLALDLHYKKLPLTYWKQNVDRIVTLINLHSEKSTRYPLNKMLKDYFTSVPPVVPQKQEKMYKFKVGDKVCLDLSAKQRKDLSFKYSLNKGVAI
jgi:hypothetical protein